MKYFKRHKDLFFIKLFSFNFLGVIGKSTLLLITQKVIAVFLGPDGIAVVGNLKNALAVLGIGATAGVDQGLLNYQSKFDKNPQQLKKVYSTSLVFSLVGSLIVFIILSLGAKFWSNYLFETKDYSYLFVVLSFVMPFFALYNLSFSIINGKSNYKKATLITCSAGVISALLVLFLVFKYNLSGVLFAVAITPLIQFCIMLLFGKEELELLLNSGLKFTREIGSKLFGFIVMSFSAVALSNLVDLKLRNYLIDLLTIKEAGYWTAISNLSIYYMSIMTGVYALYVLPKYAKIKDFQEFKLEFFDIIKIILPIFTVLFLGIYLGRTLVIYILFSKEFLPMEILFKWQLLGDLVKITAIIMGYQLIARNSWKLFILSELLSYILLYVFAVYFIDRMGVEGIVLAHFLRYILYLIIIYFTVKYTFKRRNKIEKK